MSGYSVEHDSGRTLITTDMVCISVEGLHDYDPNDEDFMEELISMAWRERPGFEVHWACDNFLELSGRL